MDRPSRRALRFPPVLRAPSHTSPRLAHDPSSQGAPKCCCGSSIEHPRTLVPRTPRASERMPHALGEQLQPVPLGTHASRINRYCAASLSVARSELVASKRFDDLLGESLGLFGTEARPSRLVVERRRDP